MKILYLKDSFEPKYSMRDDVQIAVQSKRKGHVVTVMTSRSDLDLRRRSRDYFEIQDSSMEGINIIRCRGFKIPFMHSCFYIPDKTIFNGYDLVHAHNIGSYSSFLPGIIKLTKRPVVLKADFNEFFYERLRKNYFLRRFILKSASLADAITAFTEKEKSILTGIGLPPGKIWIVPIGINYEEFSDLKKEDNPITIGFMGRFTPQKGVHNIIDPLKKIMNEYQEIKVIFAGQKTDAKYAEDVIKELEGYGKYMYMGFINSSRDFYSKVDIVLVPSLWETGSIITLEAMAAGKAIIASDINPHSEYIEHGVSGFLAKNEEEFYKYCKELVINENLREKLAMNAQRKAKEYDWENISTRVEEIYSRVISSKR